MARLIDADCLFALLNEEMRTLKITKSQTEKEYQGGFDLRIAEADLIKEYVEHMPTVLCKRYEIKASNPFSGEDEYFPVAAESENGAKTIFSMEYPSFKVKSVRYIQRDTDENSNRI